MFCSHVNVYKVIKRINKNVSIYFLMLPPTSKQEKIKDKPIMNSVSNKLVDTVLYLLIYDWLMFDRLKCL